MHLLNSDYLFSTLSVIPFIKRGSINAAIIEFFMTASELKLKEKSNYNDL
jgi:hypothetical protein